ncbi:MAG TPA: hypothetical protein VMU17_01160, partial [Elusimicrobiota bacterium]|nr:hypothetical protein [Elusimicrobiota bacterium]
MKFRPLFLAALILSILGPPASTLSADESTPAASAPFAVPVRLGSISDYYAGNGTRHNQLVVLIQDLHANVGVQKNIASMLYRLLKLNKRGMLLVCVEGASGEGDVSLLRSLPGAIRHGFEAMLLHKAYLTGAELAATEAAADWAQQQSVLWYRIKSWLSPQDNPTPVSISPIHLWGVDDPELYRKNWHAAKVVDRQQQEALNFLRGIKATLAAGAQGPLQKQFDLLTKLLLLRLQPGEYQEYLKGRSLNPKGPPIYENTIAAGETYY